MRAHTSETKDRAGRTVSALCFFFLLKSQTEVNETRKGKIIVPT